MARIKGIPQDVTCTIILWEGLSKTQQKESGSISRYCLMRLDTSHQKQVEKMTVFILRREEERSDTGSSYA